jgi:N-acetylglucosamine kinase-like BadF-type ATPase
MSAGNSGVVIGIDGGGTKTSTACVSVHDRETLGIAKTGCSNFNSVGAEKAKEALREGIFESIKTANRKIEDG